MPLFSFAKTLGPALAVVSLLGLSLCGGIASASAAPAFASGFGSPASIAEPVRIYRRGRPPIYPYYYSPGHPGGYSFYFGFVPYQKGDYETQALQRMFPEANYPPSMRAWTPRSGF
ncbi:MAG: hypothetical protein JJE37_11550 [Methyloceanibacter sp.]|jgi:hypothetical protein|nr:hypothetical protein [Methyloceanibacter sp.]